MNVANKITVFRVILVPFLIYFILNNNIKYNYLYSLIIFLISCYTDYLDGKIARNYNQITKFGQFADPLVDKILIISVLICFIDLKLINSIGVILIIIREFIITFLRLMISSEKSSDISANKWGKVKTISQMVSIIFILLFQIININNNIFNIINNILFYNSVILSVISGFIYIYLNKNIILKNY